MRAKRALSGSVRSAYDDAEDWIAQNMSCMIAENMSCGIAEKTKIAEIAETDAEQPSDAEAEPAQEGTRHTSSSELHCSALH